MQEVAEIANTLVATVVKGESENLNVLYITLGLETCKA